MCVRRPGQWGGGGLLQVKLPLIMHQMKLCSHNKAFERSNINYSQELSSLVSLRLLSLSLSLSLSRSAVWFENAQGNSYRTKHLCYFCILLRKVKME